jgi:hypothetical protein
MDDFLHNLRSGKLKQPDRGRRDYSDYKGPQRRVGNDRRRTDYYAKVTNENFALIKETLDILIAQQRRIADAAVARESSEASVAKALETIALMMARRWGYEDLLSHGSEAAYSTSAAQNSREAAATEEKEIQTPDNTTPPGLLKIIETMRTQGGSWEKIARHFDDQGIPTVSGKGKWRGPAVKKFWETHAHTAGT